MKQHFSKQLAVLFSFLLIFANVTFVQPTISHAQNLAQAVTISVLDSDGSDIVGMKAVPFEDGDTALDILEEVAEVETEDSDWGPMIKDIEGIIPIFDETEAFWAFHVNGGFADDGADGYEVKNGDNIVFLHANNKQENPNVNITIKGKDDTIVDNEAIEMMPYATAYDVLQQVAQKNNIPLDVTVHSEYFTFINNINNEQFEENDFWGFYVNDDMAQIGAVAHKIKENDHILFEAETYILEEPEEPKEPVDPDEEPKDTEEQEQPSDNKGSTNEDDNKKEEEQETSADKSVINKRVQDDLAFLKQEIKNRGLLTGPEYVWAYAKAGGDVPDAYDDIAAQLKNDSNFTNEYNSTNEIAKVIIALSTAGFNAEDVDGVDLVQLLVEKEVTLTTTAVATQVYALNAFNSGDYDVSEEIIEQLIQGILDKQMTSGGWGYFGDTPSPDITGMTLDALSPYQSREEVDQAAQKAIDYLANGFDGEGWYHDQWSGGYTSEAISQVIVGLTSYGIDPIEPPFVDDKGKSLLSYLLDFKADDGLYKHVHAAEGSDAGFATSQAFLALAYYQYYFLNSDDADGEKPEEPENSEENDDQIKDENGTTDEEKPKSEEEEETIIIDNGLDGSSDTTVIGGSNIDQNGEQLPKTSTNMFNTIAFGLLFLAIGMVIIVLRKKWQTN